jgi:hypothetical protein
MPPTRFQACTAGVIVTLPPLSGPFRRKVSEYGTEKELRIRESPKTGWFVEGLREFLVRTPEEAMRFLARGESKKHTAESESSEPFDKACFAFPDNLCKSL